MPGGESRTRGVPGFGPGSGVGNALKLPCPPNISVFWNGGSLLGITVGIQIATGLILSIRYNSDASIAFGVVLGISRESDFG